MLWNAVLTEMSIFGMTYDASPLTCVRNGLSKWQYGLVGDVYGRAACTSQLSVAVRPELVPPDSVRPLRTRAETFTSTPFQCWLWCSPRLRARFTRLSVRPNCDGSTL